ncbi:hypothetical protein WAI453_008859 [Rhynchosporium graminicola]
MSTSIRPSSRLRDLILPLSRSSKVCNSCLSVMTRASAMYQKMVKKDGMEIVWISHNNRLKKMKYGWKMGKEFREDHDMFRLIEVFKPFGSNHFSH